MGVGKSRIGRELAARTGLRLIDLDAFIEAQQGQKIAEIFKEFDEEHFRRIETAALVKLRSSQPAIISLGGGATLKSPNRDICKTGHWFFLHRPLSLIEKRLKFSGKRPLLKKDSWKDLYRRREPIYRLATHTLYCENFSSEVIVGRILKLIQREEIL